VACHHVEGDPAGRHYSEKLVDKQIPMIVSINGS